MFHRIVRDEGWLVTLSTGETSETAEGGAIVVNLLNDEYELVFVPFLALTRQKYFVFVFSPLTTREVSVSVESFTTNPPANVESVPT